jgi:hypothetical protein
MTTTPPLDESVSPNEETLRRTPLVMFASLLADQALHLANELSLSLDHSQCISLVSDILVIARRISSSQPPGGGLNPMNFRRPLHSINAMTTRVSEITMGYSPPPPGAAHTFDATNFDHTYSEMELDVLYFLIVLCIGRRDDGMREVAPLYEEVAIDINHVFGENTTVPRELSRIVHHRLCQFFPNSTKLSGECAKLSDEAVKECSWELWRQYERLLDYYPYTVARHGLPNLSHLGKPMGIDRNLTAPMTTARSKLMFEFERYTLRDPVLAAAFQATELDGKNAAFREYIGNEKQHLVQNATASSSSSMETEGASLAPRPPVRRSISKMMRDHSTRFTDRTDLPGVTDLLNTDWALTVDNVERATTPVIREFVLDIQRRSIYGNPGGQRGIGALVTHEYIQVIVSSLKGKTSMYGNNNRANSANRKRDATENDRLCPAWVLLAVTMESAISGLQLVLNELTTDTQLIDTLIWTACNALSPDAKWTEPSSKDLRILPVGPQKVLVAFPPKFLTDLRWMTGTPTAVEPSKRDLERLNQLRAAWGNMGPVGRAVCLCAMLVHRTNGFATLSSYAATPDATNAIPSTAFLQAVTNICARVIRRQHGEDTVPEFLEFLKTPASHLFSAFSTALAAVGINKAPIPPIRRHCSREAKVAIPVTPPQNILGAHPVSPKSLVDITELMHIAYRVVNTRDDFLCGDVIGNLCVAANSVPPAAAASAVGNFVQVTMVPKEQFANELVYRRPLSREAMDKMLTTRLVETLCPISQRILMLTLANLNLTNQLEGIDTELTENVTLDAELFCSLRDDPSGETRRNILYIALGMYLRGAANTRRKLIDCEQLLKGLSTPPSPSDLIPCSKR